MQRPAWQPEGSLGRPPETAKATVGTPLGGRAEKPLSLRPRALLVVGWVALGLGGCATAPAPGPQTGPVIARMSPAAVAALPAPSKPLTAADILALHRQGLGAEAILARVRSTGTRLELTPTQVWELHGQGVPLAVLDGLHQAWRRGLEADLAQAQTVAQNQRQAAVAAREQAQQAQAPWPAAYPYSYGPGWGYGGYGGWGPYGRSGIFFGW